TDFERVEIQFGNTANSGIWYFDNLTQGQSTVDPCEGVEPIAGIVDDFDCQRNVAIGAGAGALTVVANPVPGGLNADPLDKVGQYTDPFDEWSALVYDYGEAMDLTNRNQLSVLIYSPITTNLLFKLEGGTVAPVEIPIDIATANSWVQYQIDFSDAADVDHTRLVIFFQAGSIPAQENVYYVDDVQWKPQPIRGCVANFEEPDFTLETWTYFGNADLDGAAAGVVVDNPDPDAVNMSAKVGRFEEAVGGQVWAGMYADTPAPMVMPTDNKTATMKVWMDHAGPVVMKMEGGIDGAPGSGDVSSDYSSPNEWAELTFDFSHLPDNAAYGRVTLIMDIGSAPETDNRISYFDDISIAGEPCIATGLFQPAPEVAAMRVMPNPAHDLLRVDQPENVRTFRIQNLFGQTLQTLSIAGVPGQVQMDISNLEAGMYLLTAYDAQGRLVANSKFIKQ
ncbi:MAG: T9SS type A sorting domain-containing protein, partial [Lewinella sp.]|nr:T9SS type A sorting domain-containing protein [Lewinella sp.]